MSVTVCRAAALITGSSVAGRLERDAAAVRLEVDHAGQAAELVRIDALGELERHVPIRAPGDLSHVLDGDEPARRG